MTEILTIRDMAGKPISSTYKGILRVSNNLNLAKGEEDKFLNNRYYCTNIEEGDAWFGNGIDKTYTFISERKRTTFQIK